MSTRRPGDDEHDDAPFEADSPTLTFGYVRAPDSLRNTGAGVEVPRLPESSPSSTRSDAADPSNAAHDSNAARDSNAAHDSNAAGVFAVRKLPAAPARLKAKPQRRPVPSQKAPVTFASQRMDSGTLTGTTIPEADLAAAASRAFTQWSGTLMRLQATRPTSPDRIGHRAVLRAFVCHDGRDVVRYGLYVDPDEGVGFDGSGRAASYSLQVRELNVYRYGIGGPGRVELTLAGQLNVAGHGELRFESTVAFDGTGRVELGKPRLAAGSGRVVIEDGSVVAGWWRD